MTAVCLYKLDNADIGGWVGSFCSGPGRGHKVLGLMDCSRQGNDVRVSIKELLVLWTGAKMREYWFVTEPMGSTSYRHLELMNSALHLKHPREGGWARKEGCRNSV